MEKTSKLGIMTMNTKQKIVFWVGISIIGILLVYPPYNVILDDDIKLNIGHRNIITPSGGITKDERELSGAPVQNETIKIKIDIFRLLLELVLVGAITKGGIWAFKEEKNKTV